MEKPVHHPYPIPEFIDYLERVHQEPTEDPEHYAYLAGLLQACFDVVEEANEHWKRGAFAGEEAFENSETVCSGTLERLIPSLLEGMIGGWFELLCYIDDPERYPWYDPEEVYPSSLYRVKARE